MARDLDQLAEEDRKALRGSKFAPLPSISTNSRSSQPRLAHPGGPLRTNKAAALAKFLERKLQDPNGLKIDPDLIEMAVKNAKETVKASSSGSGKLIQHVTSFDDPKYVPKEETKATKPKKLKVKKMKQKKKKSKNKALKAMIDS